MRHELEFGRSYGLYIHFTCHVQCVCYERNQLPQDSLNFIHTDWLTECEIRKTRQIQHLERWNLMEFNSMIVAWAWYQRHLLAERWSKLLICYCGSIGLQWYHCFLYTDGISQCMKSIFLLRVLHIFADEKLVAYSDWKKVIEVLERYRPVHIWVCFRTILLMKKISCRIRLACW